MSNTLEATTLEVQCHSDGTSKATVWCKCYSPEDIDDVIVWLRLAKSLLEDWRAERGKERDR